MRPPPRLKSLLQQIPGLTTLVRDSFNRDFAAIERSLAAGSGLSVLQPWTTSSDDRYPRLFDRLAVLLGELGTPNVLSFGCAGGEEVRALKRRLPRASIVGVDVNERALARARRKDRDGLSRYLVGDRPPQGEQFDAVLAIAVFRHGVLGQQKPERCTEVLPFARAAETFAALDQALRPAGVLVWGNAHFLLTDLPGGDRYQIIENSADLDPFEVAYGPDDRQVSTQGESGGLYRKCA